MQLLRVKVWPSAGINISENDRRNLRLVEKGARYTCCPNASKVGQQYLSSDRKGARQSYRSKARTLANIDGRAKNQHCKSAITGSRS